MNFFCFPITQETIIVMVDQYLIPLQNEKPLNSLKDGLLELPLHLLALVVGSRLTVESEQSTEVKLGRLEQLNLANVNLEETSSKLVGYLTMSLEMRCGAHTFCRG